MIKKIYKKSDELIIRWRIIFPALLLVTFSLIILKYTSLGAPFITSSFYKQLIWFLIGALLFYIFQNVRVQFFQEYAYHFYLIIILCLVVTYFMPIISGSHRWIKVGLINFQPSEIGKIFLIFTISRFLSENQLKSKQIKNLIFVILLALIPAILVFFQPDFGTSIVYIFIVLPMAFWSGIRSYYIFSFIAPIISILAAFKLQIFSFWMLILVIIIFLNQPKLKLGVLQFIINISCGILSPYIWSNFLYQHHRERILTLLDPMSDPQGAGYQIIQSITAIGSGGIWGKGIGLGTQTQLRYLPVRDTDFIISVIGEEKGIFGILIILFLFSIMFYWIINYSKNISNKFSALSLIGFSYLLFFHLLVNMGMTVGIFPVTGLPAPFLSYGGSFLVTCILILAIINNIINSHI
tara:strand:+ start:314 stop:1540 length:1227 start_codon:yes stop_codon:yes gene_type:complete